MGWGLAISVKIGWAIAAALALAAQSVVAQDSVLEVDPDKLIAVEINGAKLDIVLQTGATDRLTLHPQTVERLAIKPATFFGKVSAKIGGVKVLTGRNRPMTFTIEGVRHKARVIWFEGATGGTGDGSIGPWAIPRDQVAIRLGGTATTPHIFPLYGSISSAGYTAASHDGGAMGVLFAVEHKGPYPIATAAAGAAIARAYDGVATGEVWDEPIALGIERPVRLVRLGRPLVIGPFSFDAIAVRVRDRRDGLGAGDRLPEPPSPDDDPSEIIVTAPDNKGPQPIFSFKIGRTALAQCSRLEYIKSAKEIRLSC